MGAIHTASEYREREAIAPILEWEGHDGGGAVSNTSNSIASAVSFLV